MSAPPPRDYLENWRVRRERLFTPSKPTYEVYPDQPYRPRMRLVIIGERFMEKVDINGYSLDDFQPLHELKPRRQEWFLRRVQEARTRLHDRLVADHDMRERRRAWTEEQREIRRISADTDELRKRLAQAEEEAWRADFGPGARRVRADRSAVPAAGAGNDRPVAPVPPAQHEPERDRGAGEAGGSGHELAEQGEQ